MALASLHFDSNNRSFTVASHISQEWAIVAIHFRRGNDLQNECPVILAACVNQNLIKYNRSIDLGYCNTWFMLGKVGGFSQLLKVLKYTVHASSQCLIFQYLAKTITFFNPFSLF